MLLVENNLIKAHVGAVVVAGILMALAILTQVLAKRVRNGGSNLAMPTVAGAGLIEDENDVDFTGCCTLETLEFILPHRKHRLFEQLLHLLL